MPKEEKILTVHPKGKKGVNISLEKYTILKDYILDVIKEKGTVTFEELFDGSIKKLQDSFDGKVGWYCVSVKLDLEARGIIERIPKTSPHQLRMTEN